MKDLLSSDVKTRLQALEKTYSKMQSKQFYRELHVSYLNFMQPTSVILFY